MPQTSSLHLTSVILVSYQTGAVLFSAIERVLRQATPVELIIVDNGNPDEVIERLGRLTTTDSRVRLITGHGNIGFGRANNSGVAASTGDYLLILNPDCLLHDDTLVKLQQLAATLTSPFIIGARIVNEDGSDQRGCRRDLLTPTTAFVEALHLSHFFPHLRLNRQNDPMPDKLVPVPAISGACLFLPRTDYDLIGGFDEAYFLHVEDLDFCWRFRKAGGEIYFAPDASATHVGATSKTSPDFIERCKAKSFTLYFHRNFSDKYPLIFLWCLDIAIWTRYVLRRLLNSGNSKL